MSNLEATSGGGNECANFMRDRANSHATESSGGGRDASNAGGAAGASVKSKDRTAGKVSMLARLIWDEFFLCDPASSSEKAGD